MAGYKPLYVSGNQTGLVENRQNFLLAEDAYPVLENAYVWREQIRRKQGYQLLGQLRRVLTAKSLGSTVAAQLIYTFADIFASFSPAIGVNEPNKKMQIGSLLITIGTPDTATFQDNGLGGFTVTGAGVALGSSINYATGSVTIVLSASTGGAAISANINYYPQLPVMGLRQEELNGINTTRLIAFDTIYAYRFTTEWQEFIPGTIWTGTDSDFFWSTNYWVSSSDLKIFWVTNDSGVNGDPIRYTDGSAWIDFAPQIDSAANLLTQCLAMLPFRGRLVVFNTLEGMDLNSSISYSNRIRWSAIGTPFSTTSSIVTAINVNAWRDDIRGQGGFLDIPTSEDIISIGFVRDNLVIYCEQSTWQLRYTGRSIAPFQIERVNSELGAQSTFSAVQFDTSLVGIGDKGVVECDSFKSERIDIKIPDLVFQFNSTNNGLKRVHGIRDLVRKLAYWTYPYIPRDVDGSSDYELVYPNRRLVYNYENDSWAIFTDSLTTLGTFQPPNPRKWSDFAGQGDQGAWQLQNYPWFNRPTLIPAIVGGNQQGYVEYLNYQVSNSVSLSISNITGAEPNPTIVNCVNHNLITGQIIEIFNVLPTDPFFTNINSQIFYVEVTDEDNFVLYIYDEDTLDFNIPQLDPSSNVYLGGAQIAIRDNFRIVSKKFNALEDGQKIQLGYIDILLNNTEEGAISLNVFMDYNDNSPINTANQNLLPDSVSPDTFFNTVIPTTPNQLQGIQGTKNWQRVFCPTRGQFVTLEYTLSNAQMVGNEQQSDVQIDAQVIHMRAAGRLI